MDLKHEIHYFITIEFKVDKKHENNSMISIRLMQFVFATSNETKQKQKKNKEDQIINLVTLSNSKLTDATGRQS